MALPTPLFYLSPVGKGWGSSAKIQNGCMQANCSVSAAGEPSGPYLLLKLILLWLFSMWVKCCSCVYLNTRISEQKCLNYNRQKMPLAQHKWSKEALLVSVWILILFFSPASVSVEVSIEIKLYQLELVITLNNSKLTHNWHIKWAKNKLCWFELLRFSILFCFQLWYRRLS